MLTILESVLQSKIEFRYLADEETYLAYTTNALGKYEATAKQPHEAVRKLKSNLFTLMAKYLQNNLVSH